MNAITPQPADHRAAAAQEARIGLLSHATAYAVVIPMIITVNVVFVPHVPFFIFPMLGWGLGLAMHALGYRRTARHGFPVPAPGHPGR